MKFIKLKEISGDIVFVRSTDICVVGSFPLKGEAACQILLGKVEEMGLSFIVFGSPDYLVAEIEALEEPRES